MHQCCVTGWYYPPEMMAMLEQLRDAGVQVTVIGHREPSEPLAVPFVLLPDVGLEWGSYSYFLDHLWTGGDTLLLHDDVQCSVETILTLFRARENNQIDLAHVFTDEDMARENVWHHGRAIMASARYLHLLKDGPGIWYDRDNHGQTTGPGCNRGCHHFYFTMGALKEEDPTLRTSIMIAPDMAFGFRGLMGEAGRQASERFAVQAEG